MAQAGQYSQGSKIPLSRYPYCDIVGREAAYVFHRGSPIAEILAPAYAPYFSALSRLVVGMMGQNAEDTESSAKALRQVFLPRGANVPDADPALFKHIHAHHDLPPLTKDEKSVAHWAGKNLGLLARDLSDQRRATDKKYSSPVPPGSGVDTRSFEEAVAELQQQSRDQDIFDKFTTFDTSLRRNGYYESVEAADEAQSQDIADREPDQAGIFTAQTVQGSLSTLAASISATCPAMADAVLSIAAEATSELPAREAVATGMAVAAQSMPFSIRSDWRIGPEVHKVLADRYVALRQPDPDLYADVIHDSHKAFEQTVIGSSTRGVPKELSTLLSTQGNSNWFFSIFSLSMQSPKLDWTTKYRTDLADRKFSMIWEVKPVTRLHFAVPQEMLYRVTFNLVQAMFAQCWGIYPIAPPLTSGGKFHQLGLPRNGMMRPIDVTSFLNGFAFAMPFQSMYLPGIIPYYVFRIRWKSNSNILKRLLRAAVNAAVTEAKMAADQLPTAMRQAMFEAIYFVEDIIFEIYVSMIAALIMICVITILELAVLGSVALVFGAEAVFAAVGTLGAVGLEVAVVAGEVAAAAQAVGLPVGASLGGAASALVAANNVSFYGAAIAAEAAGFIFKLWQDADDAKTPDDGTVAASQRMDLTTVGVDIQGLPVACLGPLMMGVQKICDKAFPAFDAQIKEAYEPA